MNSKDEFEKIGPAWINNLRCDIEEKTAQPEDVEKFLRYYCHLYHLYQSPKGIPPKVLDEVLRLINQVFARYLYLKEEEGQLYGVFEAAFGFTRKQGDRNLEKRNEDIATDIARYRLSDYSVIEAVAAVSGERELKHSTINEAWRKHKDLAYLRVRIEYKQSGKLLSDEQFKVMDKDLGKKFKQISDEIFGSYGK